MKAPKCLALRCESPNCNRARDPESTGCGGLGLCGPCAEIMFECHECGRPRYDPGDVTEGERNERARRDRADRED